MTVASRNNDIIIIIIVSPWSSRTLTLIQVQFAAQSSFESVDTSFLYVLH